MERVVGYGSPGNVTTIQAPVVRQGDVSTESTMEDAWSNYISRLCREYYTYSTLEGGVITIRGGVADDLRTLGHFLRVDEHGNVTIVPTQFSRHATDLSGR
jgi:hypothetical protein